MSGSLKHDRSTISMGEKVLSYNGRCIATCLMLFFRRQQLEILIFSKRTICRTCHAVWQKDEHEFWRISGSSRIASCSFPRSRSLIWLHMNRNVLGSITEVVVTIHSKKVWAPQEFNFIREFLDHRTVLSCITLVGSSWALGFAIACNLYVHVGLLPQSAKSSITQVYLGQSIDLGISK